MIVVSECLCQWRVQKLSDRDVARCQVMNLQKLDLPSSLHGVTTGGAQQGFGVLGEFDLGFLSFLYLLQIGSRKSISAQDLPQREFRIFAEQKITGDGQKADFFAYNQGCSGDIVNEFLLQPWRN
ncbi:hypothetical protein D3C78_1591520 [compost metagenome]